MASTPMAIDSPIGLNGINGFNGTARAPPPTGKLSDLVSIYRPTKSFRREPPSLNKAVKETAVLSIDFDDSGDHLLTSESDNSLQIYNVKEGKFQKTSLSQKYGANHAMFTHKDSCIIHSSTKQNHTIRYLSTHDNNYLRYFEGHEQNVTCLSLHPGQDQFLSCSEDNTVRMWDIGTKNVCGTLDLTGAHLAAWDPTGNVFAVASPVACTILLYDARNYDHEPFSSFDLFQMCHEYNPACAGKGWNKLEFSNDGKSILVGTTGKGHFLLDAFDGSLKSFLVRERGGTKRAGAGDHSGDSEDLSTSTGDCCFTSDGRFVISGMRKENVLVWDTLMSSPDKKLKPIHELEHKGEAAVVAFNPRYNFFATGDKELVFWMPDLNAA
ncbi:WD repeat protein [Phlyctema vagabunda]|uniref:WD repeat protein n=1 Tax=Phlyctema vagabunda TaxID=108571 RepID=A0ABR4PIW6_9HELO